MFTFENKNVIFIIKVFDLGGAERQCLALADYLQNTLNCNVYIYSYIKVDESKVFHELCKNYNLTNLHEIPNPFNVGSGFKTLKRLIKIVLFGLKLRKHSPDIIIPFMTGPSKIAAIARYFSGAKFTYWNHRGMENYDGSFIQRFAVKLSSTFIANSVEGTQEIYEQLGISKAKVHFVPNMVVIPVETKINRGNTDKVIKIGMVANFSDHKYHMLVLKVFESLSQKYDFIQLVLVGNPNGNSLNAVNEYVISHDLGEKVMIHHNTQGVDIIPTFDIGVLMSEIEGMSNVIMEYMFFELPIVASNHSGSKTLLQNDYEFLIENDFNELFNALQKLIDNEAYRLEVGTQNKRKLNSEYLPESHVRKLLEVLNKRKK